MSESAITLPDRLMTVDEFLAWAETLPSEAGQFQLWDGRVYLGPKGPRGQLVVPDPSSSRLVRDARRVRRRPAGCA